MKQMRKRFGAGPQNGAGGDGQGPSGPKTTATADEVAGVGRHGDAPPTGRRRSVPRSRQHRDSGPLKPPHPPFTHGHPIVCENCGGSGRGLRGGCGGCRCGMPPPRTLQGTGPQRSAWGVWGMQVWNATPPHAAGHRAAEVCVGGVGDAGVECHPPARCRATTVRTNSPSVTVPHVPSAVTEAVPHSDGLGGGGGGANTHPPARRGTPGHKAQGRSATTVGTVTPSYITSTHSSSHLQTCPWTPPSYSEPLPPPPPVRQYRTQTLCVQG